MCLLQVFSIAGVWLSRNTLQMFGETSDNINQNYTVIDVSFFPNTHAATCISCFCPLKIPVSFVALLWFPSPWYHFDFPIQPPHVFINFHVWSHKSLFADKMGFSLEWTLCEASLGVLCEVITLLWTWIKPPMCWQLPPLLVSVWLCAPSPGWGISIHTSMNCSHVLLLESAMGKAVWVERTMSAFRLHCSEILGVNQLLSPVTPQHHSLRWQLISVIYVCCCAWLNLLACVYGCTELSDFYDD